MLFRDPQALSSTLALLGMLQPRAFGSLNRVETLDSASNYYLMPEASHTHHVPALVPRAGPHLPGRVVRACAFSRANTCWIETIRSVCCLLHCFVCLPSIHPATHYLVLGPQGGGGLARGQGDPSARTHMLH